MSPRLGRLSVQARLIVVTAVLSLIGLTAIGMAIDVLIRDRIEENVFSGTQRAAMQCLGALSTGRSIPNTASGADLLQLVDSSGRVVAANSAAAGRPRLSTAWPSSHERTSNGTECAGGECVMFTAGRPSPQEEQLLWHGDSHVVYAGRARPAILEPPNLEFSVTAGVLGVTALMTSVASLLISRTLQPVEAMRTKIAEITVSDLGQRVPTLPGRDAIARLARTANRTLARLQEAVELQQRYSSMVSHELRTPLTGLRTRLEEALTYPDVDPYDAMRDALATMERVQVLIDEMLLLTRVTTSSPHSPERVDLSALVREETADCGANLTTRVWVQPGLQVRGSRVQLAEVLTNLLANAQRHACGQVEVSVKRADGHAVLTVADDGCGIAPEDRERVFDPFVRLPDGRARDPHGSGLGLAICRAIAHAHQGTLCVEESRRGARFVLRLPLTEPTPDHE
ncbi:sensor histidine kinase [Nonomuraea jiangxiensis]|uniref:histidine kinase n=1 Tax=Nonomuraea jiangxiensis TaxID=633440 RepID=A0A1G8DNF1_9ACTN|nr:HAMP domain-containing sensor histidine kinase [Nonomuraea jiangxiensis]SDH59223.1 Signal transduction histidine kinase [Nonomuraea jiangxiensis]